MPRCGECKKMVALKSPEVAIEDLHIGFDRNTIVGSIRVTRNCVNCNCIVKETYFPINLPVNHSCTQTGIRIIGNTLDATHRFEGSGRFKTSWYGYNLGVRLHCRCGQNVYVGSEADVKASAMDNFC